MNIIKGVLAPMQRLQSVDGLRCLAVIGVLIFHINSEWLPGGYLGVDLFFVISGFVVTMSLDRRKMSYPGFLARRFYRLAPAGAMTIIATLLMFHYTGLGLLTPEHAYSGLSAFFAVSNLYFMTHASYFDTALHGNPFLHYWSLSVEEQFYVAWPAVIFLLSIFRHRTLVIVYVLIFFTVISFLINVYFPQQAFYLMPARAYQFAAGAAGYFIISLRKITVHFVAFYALTAAVIAMFTLFDGTQSWWVGGFMPTLLFGLLVPAAAKVSADPLFRSWPVQIIARSSYSIYLVHWPIVVYAAIVYGSGFAVCAGVVVTSILLGMLLFYGIERPLNHYQVKGRTFTIYVSPSRIAGPVVSGLAVAVASLIIFSGVGSSPSSFFSASSPATSNENAQSDSPASSLLIETKSQREAASKKLWRCNTFEVGRNNGNNIYKLLADLDLEDCLSGNDAIFVDSSGVVAVPIIAMIAKSSDFAILGSAGCHLLVSPLPNDCGKMNNLRMGIIHADECKYKNIYISMNWSKYSDEYFDKMIYDLGQTKCRITILNQLPNLTANPSQFVAAAGGGNPDLSGNVSPSALKRHEQISAISMSNIDVVESSTIGSPLPALTEDGMPIYKDEYHYTEDGVNWLLRKQAEKLAGGA